MDAGQQPVDLRFRPGGRTELFWQAANGTGPVQRLTDSPTVKNPTAVAISPGGRQVIFTETGSNTTGLDVMQVELDGTHRVTPLVQAASSERNGVVSPDGRWLAYEASGTSGQFQIYVRPLSRRERRLPTGVYGRRHSPGFGRAVEVGRNCSSSRRMTSS